jgi:iron complex outermembrane receptor protein
MVESSPASPHNTWSARRSQELFSGGPHDATTTFDIGDPNLKIEVANSIEAGLRRAVGPFRFELTGFYTKFDGFIFRRLTGNTCSGDACILGPGEELKQAVYSQRDATFRGVEFQSQYEVAPLWTGVWGIENQFDVVRATFADGTNVPRIPPVRVGGGPFYRDSNWLARVNLLHAFPRRYDHRRTPTPDTNQPRPKSVTTKLQRNDFGVREITVGVRNNLLNDDIRNSVSYNKTRSCCRNRRAIPDDEV